MDQEVRVYDRWGNLKEVISDKRAREISETNFMNIGFPTHNHKIAVERKCWCGVTFTTKKKRQVNCNTEECLKKKKRLLREAKKEKRARAKEAALPSSRVGEARGQYDVTLEKISFFYLFFGLSLFP